MEKRKWNLKTLYLLPLILLTCLLQNANAIPISGGFVPAGVAQYQNSFFYQGQKTNYVNSGQIPGTNQKLDIDVSLFGYLYVPTNKWQIFAYVPYVSTYLHGSAVAVAPGVIIPFSLTQKGLGDPTFVAMYRAYQATGVGWTYALGLQGALGVPLGTYANNRNVPRILEPGTGNFVPTVAISSFYQSIVYGLATVNLSYSNPLMRNGYKFSNQFKYNLSLGHNIYPFMMESGKETPLIVLGQLELLGTLTGRANATNQVLNGLNSNTGGNLINLSPGIQIEGLGWSLNGSYQFPISQSLNGVQGLKFDRTFLLQFIYNNFS